MSQGLKEFIKVIALGCIVAAVIIASRFISLSNVISLQTEGTSVTTAASPADPSSGAAAAPQPSSDTVAARQLGSNAEIAAEIASRIANMTPEERQEAERPPLPDENKAQLIYPEGETLYQQYLGNYSSKTGLPLYGNVFSADNLLTRRSFEGEVPNPSVFLLADSTADPGLHKKAAEVITNMFSFRTQNYASFTCGVGSFKSEDIMYESANSKQRYHCSIHPDPLEYWLDFMKQDAYIRVDSLREVIKDPEPYYFETLNPNDDREVITYDLVLGVYDKNNVLLDSISFKQFATYWKQIDNDWKLNYMIPLYI
ncbi:hypothetical protein [Corynebacterium sp. HS2168-gen11]|uniref:hypothetical protein n=1 Tax=Corynebacterium sp. HS2168-gen11 TaxID=2974027 RepID=UPI00216B0589|nr:hypothetical protein [Corynebacterium sp. HS2168-gen11]MCS4536210.1 hypothetical protein [Corynebacterium sp. HS2168-gen11]